MKPLAFLALSSFAFIATPNSVSAQETAPASPDSEETEPADPIWTNHLGLSYVATSGNSETTTFGLDFKATRRPMPWGLEVSALLDRADQDGEETAERHYAGLRGTRTLAERWDAFAGLSGEQDEFADIDLRVIAEAGVVYKALVGPRHTLELDAALNWTDEKRLPPDIDDSWVGSLLGLDYNYAISDGAAFSQGLRYFANFDDSANWRAESLTALTATLNKRLAMRLSYGVRYRNEPLDGNDDTDTTSKVSLVWSM